MPRHKWCELAHARTLIDSLSLSYFASSMYTCGVQSDFLYTALASKLSRVQYMRALKIDAPEWARVCVARELDSSVRTARARVIQWNRSTAAQTSRARLTSRSDVRSLNWFPSDNWERDWENFIPTRICAAHAGKSQLWRSMGEGKGELDQLSEESWEIFRKAFGQEITNTWYEKSYEFRDIKLNEFPVCTSAP